MSLENDDILTESKIYNEQEVTPKDLLRFAKLILAAIAGLFILGMFCQLITQDKIIFESCKMILPPVATLVIGFYFGKSN
jgi:hypothetical protein